LTPISLTRRETLAGIAAGIAAPLLARATPAFARAATDAQASALLNSFADNLLRLYPEQATSLGVDKGPWAPLRSKLQDRSITGQHHVAQVIRADLARAEAIDTSALSFPVRTSVEVVKYAYRLRTEGFALPYGDGPVADNSWRNTPYVVIQNVGAYIDTPLFLDADHVIKTSADAETYLLRLAQYPHNLDGEVERMRSARGMGLVPPNFLIDKAIGQLSLAAKNASEGGSIVDSLVRRTRDKKIAGNWEARARAIATKQVFPALQRLFPDQFRGVALDTFYRAINKVERSLIRTDADEVTYNLHIMMRFDLELDLLEGRLAVKDIPDAWRARMKSDLGVEPPDDRDGCLQDVHWAVGSFGYFPSYAIGAVIAGQLYESLRADRPELDQEIAAGHFGGLFEWLRTNVYSLGASLSMPEIIQRATGKPLSAAAWLRYIESKYLEA